MGMNTILISEKRTHTYQQILVMVDKVNSVQSLQITGAYLEHLLSVKLLTAEQLMVLKNHGSQKLSPLFHLTSRRLMILLKHLQRKLLISRSKHLLIVSHMSSQRMKQHLKNLLEKWVILNFLNLMRNRSLRYGTSFTQNLHHQRKKRKSKNPVLIVLYKM